MAGKESKAGLWKEIKRHRYLLLLVMPALAWYVIFCYIPMYGTIIAFKEYHFNLGILGSPWVGWKNFQHILKDPDFIRVFKNQIVISVCMLVINFPIPVIVALMLNEILGTKVKRLYQTIFTFPHFISWVVVAGIFFSVFASEGMVNQILGAFGALGQKILMDPSKFRWLLYLGNAWKETGWGTIIYLAALAGIDPELYDASAIDGANHWRQILHITWPGIKSVVAIMFVLAVGNIMLTGFDEIINLYNSAVIKVADIIDTYVYRTTILQGQNFSVSAAIGLFKSVINMILLLIANGVVKALGEEGIL